MALSELQIIQKYLGPIDHRAKTMAIEGNVRVKTRREDTNDQEHKI
jgi:hypothetical protein